ncbi:hypothetical protein GCM10028792_05820 [Salinisphaera aquimarina]
MFMWGVEMAVRSEPLFRFFCHCRICQAFNQGPFADVTLFRIKSVTWPEGDAVAFRKHRSPPAVPRGFCSTCGGAAIELVQFLPLLKLALIPSANFSDGTFLPVPALPMFYDRRVGDVDDKLPRYSGYWPSQMAFSRRLLASLFRTRG